jgi:hypothetical protein
MARKEKAVRQKATRSLQKMLETLQPFLPKRDLRQPEPARKWKLADEGVPISHHRAGAVV